MQFHQTISIFSAGGTSWQRRDTKFSPKGQGWQRGRNPDRKSTKTSCSEVCESMFYRNQAEESETKKKHIFTGERKQVKKPKGAPAWMPAKIWKPSVKKAGVVKLEDL